MLPRFFCPAPLAAHRIVDLPEAAAHHALRVRRLERDDLVTLFDGTGGEYLGRIVEAGRVVRVETGEWHDFERESPLEVTLAQALPSSDKMDWIVQKTVELGVARIVPLFAARSVTRLDGERALRRVAHWRSVAIAACEQCGRNRIPEIPPLLDLRQWLAALPPRPVESRLLFLPPAEQGLRELPAPRVVTLLIGPEGGLTDDEETAAGRAGFEGVSLGPRVLRTETAGMAALAALAALHGDF